VILVDTGPLVALCDPRDPQHSRAARHLERLAGRGLATCDAVLAETCFHLPSPAPRQRLAAIVGTFGIHPAPAALSDIFWHAVLSWLTKYAEHEPDWADACLAVLSGMERAAKVWTYDQEFRTIWRRPDGSAIPLAVRDI
jgi:predicted nucleic acid-binding protein